MMTLNLHQSLCGENEKKAYGLLRTTLADVENAKALANKSDLPDHTQGIDFEPAVRGFIEGAYYLILKTFKDRSTQVRPNRVFTHMITGNAKDFIQFDDLRAVFTQLQNQPDKLAKITPLSVKAGEQTVIDDPVFRGRFHKLINGFVRHKEFSNTVVWIGQKGFEEALTILWRKLSPSERAELNFGIYFSTENLPSNKVNLICIPEAVQSKFSRNGYYLISPADQYDPVELSEQILAGDEAAGKRINNFAAAIGVKGFKRNEIDELSVGIKTFEEFDSITDLKKINTLSHVIAAFSPDVRTGSVFKGKLIKKLSELIKSSTPSDLIVLKHFKTDSFSKSKQELSVAVNIWLKGNLFRRLNLKIIDPSPIFELIVGPGNWLAETVKKQLKAFLEELDDQKVIIVYQWIAASPKALEISAKYMDYSVEAEDAFIKTLPQTIGVGVRKTLLDFAEKRKWLRLYAHLLLMGGVSIEKALVEQLRIDTNPKYFAGLDVLIRKVKPTEIFALTIKHPDVRLVTYCGLRCREKPNLLDKIEIQDIGWQRIWLSAIDAGNSLKDGLKSPPKVIYQLLDLLVTGKPVELELISKISESTFANVLNYPNRVKLWNVLQASARQQMLKATSAKLLDDLSRNVPTEVPDDAVLSSFILSHGIADFLYFNSNKISSTLPIFLKYSHISEQVIYDYLRNYRGEITQKEATLFGKLVLQKRFANVAAVIFQKAEKKNNWRFALAESHEMLSLLQKSWIVISGIIKTVRIPSDEWWDGISNVIIELYPNSSSLVTIWKKAGGKEYDLVASGTIRDIWLNALHRLRHRGFKHISMNDLLKEINKDYGGNNDFKALYDIRKSFVKTK